MDDDDQGTEFRLTRHAILRIRKRLGLPKRAAQREIDRIDNFLPVEECTGRLRKYLDFLKVIHGDEAHYRVTPTAVYCFKGRALVTVTKIPAMHRKSALAQWKKRNG